LYAFDNFRAIAMVLIVLGHSYPPWVINTFPENYVASFITGGTALFVFISGFFFHHTFSIGFAWRPFLRTKLVNVGGPYLVLTGAYCVVVALRLLGQVPVPEFYRWPDGGAVDLALLYLQYAVTGRAFYAYWYVPFILLMFAASPLFMRFIRLTRRAQLVVFGLTVLVSVIVHRPANNANPVHSVLYFSAVYLMGILVSLYRPQLFAFVQRHVLGVGVALAIVAMLKIAIDGHHSSRHKAAIFSFDGIDVFILQKSLQAALMLSLLLRYANRKIPALHYVAERSFAVFFIHNWVDLLLRRNVPWITTADVPGFFMFLIVATLTFLVSLVIADLLRALLKQRSRYVIGY
jgi:hypothetical protein